MCWKILYCCVILSLFHAQCNAFWWPGTTTEPPQAVIKEIPLTYFRTYTYQPLSNNGFQVPFFTYSGIVPPQNGAHSRPRFDPYTSAFMTSHNTHQLNEAPQFATTPSTTTTTPTTTTSTTTTTTTTPAPTTTPSTTTATLNNGVHYTANFDPTANGEYPTFNRRLYNQAHNPNFYRPHYPYPEYYSYPSLRKESGINTNFAGTRGSHVQFVPCMCPVSVGVQSGVPLTDQSNSIFLAQSRAAADDDNDMELPAEQEERKVKVIIEPLEKEIVDTSNFSGTKENIFERNAEDLQNKPVNELAESASKNSTQTIEN